MVEYQIPSNPNEANINGWLYVGYLCLIFFFLKMWKTVRFTPLILNSPVYTKQRHKTRSHEYCIPIHHLTSLRYLHVKETTNESMNFCADPWFFFCGSFLYLEAFSGGNNVFNTRLWTLHTGHSTNSQCNQTVSKSSEFKSDWLINRDKFSSE